MGAVGLTHGGFYGQFANKDALAAEAFDRAIKAEYRSALGVLVENDLSLRHVHTPRKGWALANDVAREPRGNPVRARFTHGVERQAVILADLTPKASRERRRQRSLATLSTLVGAVLLARAVEDEDLANDLIQAARSSVAGG